MKFLIRFLPVVAILLTGNATASRAQAPSIIPGPVLGKTPVDKPVDVPTPATFPAWSVIQSFTPEPGAPSVRSGDVEVTYAKNPLAGFIVRVNGRQVALGCPASKIGYVHGDQLHWLDFASAVLQKPAVVLNRNQIEASYQATDPDGGTWRVSQRLRPQRVPGAIDVQTEVSVDQTRPVAFLPMLLMFPGAGSFGSAKNQALFAGLEYLENEPSSSEADVLGAPALRQLPDSLKITFPLMAVQADGNYVGLSWQMRPQISALFDSPDRLFKSGAQVMGLVFPGSNGKNRTPGNVLPNSAESLHPNETVSLRATILAGVGDSVVPAVQHFAKLRPLPPLPASLNLADYVSQASNGWLDSKIRETNMVHHALAGGNFPAQPAADAALWMKWLATQEPDPARQTRLEQTASNVLSAVPTAQYNSAGVGHIRYPVECLVFGDVERNAQQAAQRARALQARFGPDGTVRYVSEQGKPNLGSTHYTNEASGLSSRVVLDLLEAVTFCGDHELIASGLERLRDLDRFRNGVPRGAQTWECPLHTPDILASAQMVRAYTLGYELTGDAHFLEQARYWAWTGVPFVYLVSPMEAPVGLYATIAVYGATQWRAPVWFGLPVQWCGLVYADALYRLVRDDPKGPWKQLADGITISGIQQSWTGAEPDYQGLLPDSFGLRDQKRNGPAINPATVQACATRLFGKQPPYDFYSFRTNNVLVHAPGRIQLASEARGRLTFQVDSWVKDSYFVLVNGLRQKPKVKINGQAIDGAATSLEYSDASGRLVLKLSGLSSVELIF
jgi:hypothetical protein